MFYKEIRIKHGICYISFCSLRILYNSKFILMAISLGTNAVVVMRVQCSSILHAIQHTMFWETLRITLTPSISNPYPSSFPVYPSPNPSQTSQIFTDYMYLFHTFCNCFHMLHDHISKMCNSDPHPYPLTCPNLGPVLHTSRAEVFSEYLFHSSCHLICYMTMLGKKYNFDPPTPFDPALTPAPTPPGGIKILVCPCTSIMYLGDKPQYQ